MTNQPSESDHLRSIARDVRFLTYRAGNPNPPARWILLVMLVPLIPIIAATFFAVVGIQLGWMKPHPKPVQQQHRAFIPSTRAPQLSRSLSNNQERGNPK